MLKPKKTRQNAENIHSVKTTSYLHPDSVQINPAQIVGKTISKTPTEAVLLLGDDQLCAETSIK